MTNQIITQATKKCKVKGCEAKYYCRGHCARHWAQIRSHGKIFGQSDRTPFNPNIFLIDGNICKIILFSKRGVKTGITIIDIEDYNKCKKFKWCLSSRGYATTRINGKPISLHKLIFPIKYTDHKDRDRLNNRKNNLRECTQKQNARNRLPCGKTSIYKGVYFNKQKNRYWARIYYNHKRIHLGSFIDERKAAKAYDKAAIKYYKEFAYLNFPS